MIATLVENIFLLAMLYGFITIIFMIYFDRQPDTSTKAAMGKAIVWPVFCWELLKSKTGK